MAYTPSRVAGSTLSYSTTAGGSYTLIPGVRGFRQNNATAEEIDTTAINDTTRKKVTGLLDDGTISHQLVYDAGDTVHKALLAAYNSGTKLFFRYVFSGASEARRMAFSGSYRQFAYSGDNGQTHLRDCEILVDGAIVEEAIP